MLNIDETVKTAFLTDSTPKELSIISEGEISYMNHSKLRQYNLYSSNYVQLGSPYWPLAPGGDDFSKEDTGEVDGQLVTFRKTFVPRDSYGKFEGTSNFLGNGYNMFTDTYDPNTDVADRRYIKNFDYLCIAMTIGIEPLVGITQPSSLKLYARVLTNSSSSGEVIGYFSETLINIDEYTVTAGAIQDDPNYNLVSFIVPTNIFTGDFDNTRYIPILQVIAVVPGNETENFEGKIFYDHVRIFVGDDVNRLPYEYKQYDSDDTEIYIPDIFIDNDNLLSESFSLNESLCSEENIKFGLCESAYCQFTVTDDYYDFRDREIKPKIKVKDESGELAHTVLKQVNLFGYEGVNSARNWPQPGTSLTLNWNGAGYNNAKNVNRMYCGISDAAKLYLNDYQFLSLTFKVKITKLDILDSTKPKPANLILATRNAVKYEDGTIDNSYMTLADVDGTYSTFNGVNAIIPVIEVENNFIEVSLKVPINYSDYFSEWFEYPQDLMLDNFAWYNNTNGSIIFKFLDEDNKSYPSNISSIDLSVQFKDMQVNFADSINEPVPEYNQYDAIEFYGETISEYLANTLGEIPLGVFTVNSIKKNHVNDIIKQEITAYDKLVLLEQNAADWYTQYMFGIDFMDDTSGKGFTFARQIYSTYYNFIKTTGINISTNKDYFEDILYTEHISGTSGVLTGTPKVMWRTTDTTERGTDWNGNTYTGHKDSMIDYLSYTISNPNVHKLYRVHVSLSEGLFEIVQECLPYYADYFDSLFRGLDGANILVEQTCSNGNIVGICVNSDDYFMLAPDCTSVTIYVAVCIQESRNYYPTGWSDFYYTFADFFQIFSTTEEVAPDLANGHVRLLYYNYGTKEIFACDSSITGRDVVRSLLEVNGCFYRLNRYTGKPEFIYCNKSGLYPRDDLYPADDLYPRLGSNQTINMSQYQSFIQEDYEVQRFGRIQILKNITSNKTKSVVEWEYIGDEEFKNSYLIEDNIFYCNDKMEYDYDGMPEVSSMLENMWLRISNMNYVPCVLRCIGMPWIECGDRIGVLTKTGGAETFIYHRTLKGIQSLIDTFESEGDEYNREVKDYGYKEWEG